MTLLRGLGVEELTAPELTGEWEYKLAQMEHGQLSRDAFMREIARDDRAHRQAGQGIRPRHDPRRLRDADDAVPELRRRGARRTTAASPASASRRRRRRCGFSISKIPGGRAVRDRPRSSSSCATSRSARSRASAPRRAGRSPPRLKLVRDEETTTGSSSSTSARTQARRRDRRGGRLLRPAEPLGPCPKMQGQRLRARHELRLRARRSGASPSLRLQERQDHPAAAGRARADGQAAGDRQDRPARRASSRSKTRRKFKAFLACDGRRQGGLRVRAAARPAERSARWREDRGQARGREERGAGFGERDDERSRESRRREEGAGEARHARGGAKAAAPTRGENRVDQERTQAGPVDEREQSPSARPPAETFERAPRRAPATAGMRVAAFRLRSVPGKEPSCETSSNAPRSRRARRPRCRPHSGRRRPRPKQPSRASARRHAASAGEVPGPPTPDAPGTRPPVLGTRTPPDAPVPGVRPQAPTDTTPPATVQTPSTRPRAPADRATPPATAPSNVGRGVEPTRANPSRATDPSNPIDPAAADPSKPADPRAREKSSARRRRLDRRAAHARGRARRAATDRLLDARSQHALAATQQRSPRACAIAIARCVRAARTTRRRPMRSTARVTR